MTHLTGEYLYNFKRDTGLSRADIAAKFNLTEGAVGGRIWRHQQYLKNRLPKEDERKLALFNPTIDRPLELDGAWLIIGDVHAPTTDLNLVWQAMAVADLYGLRNLLIAGDMLNHDIFSAHPRNGEPVPWQDEKKAARYLLEEWMAYFDRIVWTAGNHERRLSRATWGAFEMEDIRDLIIGHQSNVEVSRFGYCTINTPTGVWRITHPRNYSKLPLKTANLLAMKHQQHVITFHEHHFGMGWADDGKHIIANGGGLFEWRGFEYVMLDDSTSVIMTKGFSTLIDGYLSLYGEEPYTNWGFLEDEARAA